MLISAAPPRRRALGARRAGVAEQLEQLRSGGWERSAREAETIPLIDTGRRAARARGSELPVLVSPIVDSPLRPDGRARRARARPHATR